MTDEDLVGALQDIESGLSEWEVEFADTLHKSLARGPLSPKQRAKAEEIWKEKG